MVRYSVIVPVYNAEKTLRRCVNSLLNQNYSNMELILVNDGSSDGSGAICEEYKARYPFVVYIDKPNGGVSTARNAGLDIAKGEYVLFVDSDDYVSDQYFLTLDRVDSNRQYDMLLFSYALTDGKSVQPRVTQAYVSDCIEDSVPMFCRMIYTKTINHPVTKRFVRRIIEDNGIRFPENLYIGEDKVFNLQYMVRCNSCLVTSEILYYASLENKQSLSRKIRSDFYQQMDLGSAYARQIFQEGYISEHCRQQYVAAENLIQLREIYSEAKRMHLADHKCRFRREIIRGMCEENNHQKPALPGGVFSRLLQIPVRLKLVTMIDLMGWYLARR